MAATKCPHCKRRDCVPDVAIANAENYGDNTFHVPCAHCGKMIAVGLTRKAIVTDISKSSKPRNQSDF